ncbi:MAG: hypothetical protein K2L51_03470 [Clostridiales bacterium]|nr:hypothetical protein [Clostridiales bacterium]
MKNKSLLRTVCALLCAVFAFALAGCGNTYTDEDDYANFVKWQSRYETEKELVTLLREYDAAYTAYTEYTAKASGSSIDAAVSLAFVFEGRTVLTDENIKLVQSGYDAGLGDYVVTVTFDSVGTAILAELTANNIGGTLEIIETTNGNSFVLSSPHINSTITNGIAQINGFTEADANELYMRIASKTAERSVRRAASAYNDKRSKSSARYSMPEYLPASLAIEPQYTDASSYLQKAEAVGFTA